MERAILDELKSVLLNERIGIVPQEDGSIFFVGNEADLERGSLMLSDMGYILKFSGSTNFVQISDFNKYETNFMTKLPTCELNEAKLVEILKKFPKHCLVAQTEGVYAVIGDSLDAVSNKLRSLGFRVMAENGNFITVSLLRVKHSSKENCA